MKKFTNLLTLVILLMVSPLAWGQITIHSNDCSAATANWTFNNVTTGQPIQQTASGGYWLLEDNDNIISEAFDVSSYTGGLKLNFKLATYGAGTPDKPCLVEYSTNNGSTWSTTTFTSAIPSSTTYINSGDFNIPASTATQFKLRFKKATTGGRQAVRLQDILFTGTVAALCTAPTTQASNITFSNASTTSLGINWTNGAGAGRVVKINTVNSFSLPTTGSNPTASLAYAGSGEQVVFNGTGSGLITVTGLNPSTTYYVRVYEYCSPDRVYQSATATNNPANSQTLATHSITTAAAPYGPFCGGVNQNISINYTTNGTFTGTFTAQLSDASGSFASPTAIGTGVSPIAAVIPSTVAVGNGYRVRVVNDNPVINGTNNGSNIQILAAPSIPNITNPISSCVGTSATIIGAGSIGATSYTFWNAASAGDAITPSTTPAGNVSGSTLTTLSSASVGQYTYYIQAENGICLSTARQAVVVDVYALPVVALGNDDDYCAGTAFSAVLDAQNAGSTYSWSNSAVTQTITVTQAGTYSVTVTNANGCIGTDAVTITENALPVVNIGNDTSYCIGTAFSQILNAGNAGATYNWNNGAASTQTFTATQAGTYSVVVTDVNGCIANDSKVITQNALPVVNIGNDTSYCAGTAFSLTLNAGNAGSTYNWNSGAASTQTFTATGAGTYSVSVTDANGCIGTDSKIIIENTLPVVNLGSDTAYCADVNLSLTLNAGNAGAAYNWNNGAASTQTFVATQAGTYSVVVTDANGCVGADSKIITENILPVVNIGNDTSYCAGTAFSLIMDAGNAGASYNWNNGVAATQTFLAASAGTYTVIVTNGNGCVGTDSRTITENALPIINLGNDTSYCAGTNFSLVLNAGNAGAQYLWEDFSETQTITVTEAGFYAVIVQDVNGCLEYAEINITENALPVVDLGNDTSYCAGSAFSIVLNAGNAGSIYNWNNGAATTQAFAATQAGTYSVVITDANGCEGTDSKVISENALPVVNLGNDTSYCAGTAFSIVLNADNAGATYNWNNGAATTQTFTATQAGTYSVSVTNANGCVGTDSKVITQHALPVVDLGNDITTTNASQLLDAGAGFTSYVWMPSGQTTQQITVNQSGNYSVTVKNAAGCLASDTVTVTLGGVSIHENNNPQSTWVMYPNPAHGQLTLSVDYQGALTVDVVSINGQVLSSQKLNAYEVGQPLQIDVSRFAAGVYVIRLTGSQLQATKTLLIQN